MVFKTPGTSTVETVCNTYPQDYILTVISLSQDCPLHSFDERN